MGCWDVTDHVLEEMLRLQSCRPEVHWPEVTWSQPPCKSAPPGCCADQGAKWLDTNLGFGAKRTDRGSGSLQRHRCGAQVFHAGVGSLLGGGALLFLPNISFSRGVASIEDQGCCHRWPLWDLSWGGLGQGLLHSQPHIPCRGVAGRTVSTALSLWK